MPIRLRDRPNHHFNQIRQQIGEGTWRQNLKKNVEFSIDLFVVMVVIGAGIASTLGGKDPVATTKQLLGLDNATLAPTPLPIEGNNVTTRFPRPTEPPSMAPSAFFLYDPPLEDYCFQIKQASEQPTQNTWWTSHRSNALQRSVELVLDVQLLDDTSLVQVVVDQVTAAMNQYMVPLLIGCSSTENQQEKMDRSAYAIENASIVQGHKAPSFSDDPEQNSIHRVILTLHCLLKGYEDNDWVVGKINQILSDKQELKSELVLTNQDLVSLSLVQIVPTRAASLKSILGSDLQTLATERKFQLHPQAFYWLAEMDTWKSSALLQQPSTAWMSRYVLAILFYENVFVGDVVNRTDNGSSRFQTWLSSAESVCQWSGCDCDADGFLTRLYLDYDQLTGHLPSELGLLTHLTYLNFFENRLSGPLPTELGKLTSLKAIFLAGNMFTGQIPTHFGQLSELTRLSLPSNNLSGPIPTEIGTMTALEAVFLSNNKLSGTIPREIGMLTAITRLRISSNSLTGSIPVEIRLLTDLTGLFLDENDLTGTIPLGFGSLTALQKLSLAGNSLGGTLPPSLGGLKELTELYLQGNEFSGNIPKEMGRLSNLWDDGCELSAGNRFNDTSSMPRVCT